MSNSFKYDVAFTFLEGDHGLAVAAAERLRDRMSVFVYSENQKDIAGTDGVVKFSAVYKSEARLVVVLYRDGWGETRWTNVEQEAIRQRFHEGKKWDFLLAVPLEKGKTFPDWFPSTKIWYNYGEFGFESLIPVIDQRVQDLGGESRTETAVDRAARLGRQKVRELERLQLLESDHGLLLAKKEIERLFEILASETVKIAAADPSLNIAFTQAPNDPLAAVSSDRASFNMLWQKYGNTLRRSRVLVREYAGRFALAGWHGGPEQLSRGEVDFTLNDAGEPAWVIPKRDGTHSAPQMADHFLSRLVERAHKPRDKQLDQDDD